MVVSLDLITGILSFLFTLLVFSYLIGDNPLFRIAVYIFVGVSSGYIAAVAWWQVIWPRLVYPLVFGSMLEKGLMLVPLLGAVLIFMKISPRLAGMSRIAMAFMVGVGAAVTIAGAVAGTLIPQVMGTINAFDLTLASSRNVNLIETLFNGAFVLAGTIFTLTYFHFGARPKADGSMHRMGLIELSAWVGRIFIGITLGAVFAGVYAAALTAFIERIVSLINFIGNFL
ncbi:MAG: hypothetical protein HY863_17790 [Chloroflexi bacterium]|nr:hypothetical protein [Chloroflexota bacterium]